MFYDCCMVIRRDQFPFCKNGCGRLVAAGRSNRDIAAELFISPKTASVHVSNILGKLGVSSRGEAAATAYQQHLLDDS